MITVIISFDVREDSLERFSSVLSNVKRTLPSIPNCEGVEVYQDLDRANLFKVVEHWTSKDAYEKHLSNMAASGEWDNIFRNLNDAPESAYFKTF